MENVDLKSYLLGIYTLSNNLLAIMEDSTEDNSCNCGECDCDECDCEDYSNQVNIKCSYGGNIKANGLSDKKIEKIIKIIEEEEK